MGAVRPLDVAEPLPQNPACAQIGRAVFLIPIVLRVWHSTGFSWSEFAAYAAAAIAVGVGYELHKIRQTLGGDDGTDDAV